MPAPTAAVCVQIAVFVLTTALIAMKNHAYVAPEPIVLTNGIARTASNVTIAANATNAPHVVTIRAIAPSAPAVAEVSAAVAAARVNAAFLYPTALAGRIVIVRKTAASAIVCASVTGKNQTAIVKIVVTANALKAATA